MIECITMILSVALDLYLIYRLTIFLNREIGRRKNGFIIWGIVASAIALYFLRDTFLYGVVYIGSLVVLTFPQKEIEKIRTLLYVSNCILVVNMTNLIITCGLSFLFSKGMQVFNIPVFETVASIICFLIYSTLLHMVKRYSFKMEMELSFLLMLFVEVMLVANSFILLYAMNFTESIMNVAEKRQISIVFSIVSLGMLIELLLVIWSVVGVYFYRKMLCYKEDLLNAQIAHSEYIKQSNLELRKIKHDCREHYNVISYLLESGEYDNAQNYVQELSFHLKRIGKYYDTGSVIVDALVSEKVLAAQKYGVAFCFSGRLPEHCKLRDTEQCILFSNILNNAFEAAMKVEVLKRKVDIEVRMNGEDLLIRAVNTCSDEVSCIDGELITSKDDKDEHGFGLRNIREIVEQHQGSLDTTIEDGVFRMMVRV